MTRLLPLILLQALTLGAVLWVALRVPPKPPESPHAVRAAELIDAGRFAAARLAFERAAATHTGEVALGYLDQARRAEALGVISAPTLPPPEQVTALTALADALEARFPDDAALLRVVVLRASGRLTEASTQAAALLEASPSPWIRWHLGALRLQEARVNDAIPLLEALVKAKPGFGAGYHVLGQAYIAAKRREGAIGALQKAIEHGAGHVAEAELGRLFLSHQMWAEALPHLENSLRAQPASAETLRLIAAAHYHLKRYARAAEVYAQAYRVEPAPRTLLSVAIALHAGGQHAQALQKLDRLGPHVAEIPEILFQRALALSALKRPVKPVLERYLTFAQGVPGEEERIKQAEIFLKGPPAPTADKPPAPAAPPPAPPPPMPGIAP